MPKKIKLSKQIFRGHAYLYGYGLFGGFGGYRYPPRPRSPTFSNLFLSPHTLAPLPPRVLLHLYDLARARKAEGVMA